MPVRKLELAPGLWPRIVNYRHLLLRRAAQGGVLLLFFGTAHWSWSLFDKPLLVGNLSSSTLFDTVPLADPFAVLQILFTGHAPRQEVVVGAILLLLFYWLIGGRVWCSWVCPVNLITDLAARLRRGLNIRNAFHLPRQTKYVVLFVALVLSSVSGVAAFEWISPIGIMHREILFGIGLGYVSLLGLFVFDLLVLRHGWCGRLCPLGAFYSIVGRYSWLKMHFDGPSCTHCGECIRVCPEPQVLNLNRAAATGYIKSGDCTNCARCISVCPEDTLAFDWRTYF
jgi:ferredoxin-type protein NapH